MFQKKTNEISSTATKNLKTKDDLKNYCIHQSNSELSKYIDQAYNKDLRNAIAHSQFSLSNMQISLSNDSLLKTISFDDWSENYFIKTVLFYLELEDYLNEIHLEFRERALSNGSLDCTLGDGSKRNMKFEPEYWYW